MTPGCREAVEQIEGGELMKAIMKWLPLLAAMAIGTLVSAATPSTMKCTLTGKEVKACCCEPQKNGKLLCKLAKKEVDKCCCTGM
jgi:hypothetical protein